MDNKEEVVVIRPSIHVPDIVDPADEFACEGCQKRKAK